MASIDKTYLGDFEIYQRFIDWSKDTIYTCPNGIKLPVIDYVIQYWTKEDMDERERPVLCSSNILDYFLIKNCPFEFVQDRLKDIYDEKYYEDVKNGTSNYDTFVYPEIATKFEVVRGKTMKHKNYLWRLNRRRCKFWVSAEYNNTPLWYSNELSRFILDDELVEPSASTMYGCRTVKSLLRRLRKMNIPKNTILTCQGRFVGEELLILAK